jgi:hypothetical protein
MQAEWREPSGVFEAWLSPAKVNAMNAIRPVKEGVRSTKPQSAGTRFSETGRCAHASQ